MFKPWKTWDALIKESDFVFKNYNGGDFIDVGAFAGFYSFLLDPKSNSFDNFVSCEPDTNVQANLLENLAILTNTFNKLRISFINSPINDGNDVTIIDNNAIDFSSNFATAGQSTPTIILDEFGFGKVLPTVFNLTAYAAFVAFGFKCLYFDISCDFFIFNYRCF